MVSLLSVETLLCRLVSDNKCSGYVRPRLSFKGKMRDVESFAQRARSIGKKVVLLARGGVAAERYGTPHLDGRMGKTIAALLELPAIALIVLGTRRSQLHEIQPYVLSIPNLSIDFARLLPLVNIVVHHGETDTRLQI